MEKLYLMKNKELFQGEKYLKKDKNYFEGWYFKNTSEDKNISFIPGISITKDERKAFIQVITSDTSYYVDYDIADFTYSYDPFYIKIKDNYFSPSRISINIKDKKQKINISGKLYYSNSKNIKTNLLNPNIMGPFSYIPFMECNHAIISMKNTINGQLKINNKKINFDRGIGYIEKDWGTSFPKNYLWLQANNFKNEHASFMFSKANIPFKVFSFEGLICVLIIDNKEYKFTTYNGAKLIKYEIKDDLIDIVLKKEKMYLNIKCGLEKSHKLSAPVKGKMSKNVYETITANIKVTLRKGEKIIFTGESFDCGLEMVE